MSRHPQTWRPPHHELADSVTLASMNRQGPHDRAKADQGTPDQAAADRTAPDQGTPDQGTAHRWEDDPVSLEESLGIILDRSIDEAIRDRAMRDREPEDWQGPAAEILGRFERLVHATRVHDPDSLDGVRRAVLVRVCASTSVPMSRVAESERIGRSTMSRSVTMLQRAGLVERIIDPEDRRHLLIRATEAGRTVADQMLRARCAILARELRVLMPDDLIALVHASRSADLLAWRMNRQPWQW
jgi:DNA-binding MarR family transcriptional regulator